MIRRLILPGALTLAMTASGDPVPPIRNDEACRVYIGTYTGAGSKGIYLSRLNDATGALAEPRLVAETPNPTFLALHPNGRFLYAVNELWKPDAAPLPTVSAFAMDPVNGGLTFLNDQPSHGAGPCHLVVDPTGKTVVAANYGGGSVAAFPLGADGRLGARSAFIQHRAPAADGAPPAAPHAHGVALDPAQHLAFVTDLGLDQILVDRLDPTLGTLTASEAPPARLTPGAGPRHLVLDPSGRSVWVINEHQSTITVLARENGGSALREVQTVSTRPDGFTGKNTAAELVLHPNGRFLYGSNRGHDSIAVFAIHPDTGRLTLVEHCATGGKTPRSFGIDPTGRYLLAANQNSDTVVVFRVDPETGRLKPTGHTITVGAPTCVIFAPSR